MQIELDCINCLVQVVLKTHKLINPEDWIKISPQALKAIANSIKSDNLPIPAHVSSPLLRMLQREKPGFDPYKDIKKDSNKLATDLANDFLEKAKEGFNLEQRLLYAAAGNIIDYAIIDSLEDCRNIITDIETKGFEIDNSKELIKNLKTKKNLLYFPDNSGEIIFDKLLLQHIKANYDINIKVCIHTGYMLNDATKDEIIDLGFLEFIDEIVDIYPEFLGFDLDNEHKYLKQYFTEDSFVISKGMANYECFEEYNIDIPVFCILLAKCKPIANKLGVNVNGAVLKRL